MIKKELLKFQENEITEYNTYKKLSDSSKDIRTKKTLKLISEQELNHYSILKKYTKVDVNPNFLQVFIIFWLSKIFGLTFGLKLMEKGEKISKDGYEKISKEIPELRKLIKEEDKHERNLINLINDERLNYIGSIVLGLNDALVELTGALAGLTFAFRETKLIAIAGLITGIAASLSMSVSEYLSSKSEQNEKNPLKASIYTGLAYILVVFLLVSPYFVFNNVYFSLITTILLSIIIIFCFSFYVSLAKDYDFMNRFLEMSFLSLGVALITFLIGLLTRIFFKIEI